MAGKAPPGPIQTPDDFASAFEISRETLAKLTTYEALLRLWQKKINLVAPGTVDQIWHRHFADSAQLLAHAQHLRADLFTTDAPSATDSPPPGGEGLGVGGSPTTDVAGSPPPWPSPARGAGKATWLDLGSGAGFPGLVIAILLAEQAPATRVTLLESDQRKAAFLAEVARRTGVPVEIEVARIENAATQARISTAEIVSARALAPLNRLFELGEPFFSPSTTGLFLKGREVGREIAAAQADWSFAVELHESVTDREGRVAIITGLARRR